jgi:hypothetical protein
MTCENGCQVLEIESITEDGDKVMTCNQCGTRHRHTKSIEVNGQTVEKRDSIGRANWVVIQIKLEPQEKIIVGPELDAVGGREKVLAPEEFEEEYL